MSQQTTRSEQTGKATGRTASREVRRQQLIDAAIDSIAEHGISGTTITTVTGFAGLSLGIVNFHFRNKESLFEETLRYLATEHSNQWRHGVGNAAADPATQLLAIVDAHFHPDICTRKKLAVWFNFYGEARFRAIYRRVLADMDRERRAASLELCRRLIDAGGYRGLEARQVADTLEGLYDGLCLNMLIYPDAFTREDAMLRVRQYLAGLFPDHFTVSEPHPEKSNPEKAHPEKG